MTEKKLILSVREDMIEKAKAKGLNISKVVEDTLEGFSLAKFVEEILRSLLKYITESE